MTDMSAMIPTIRVHGRGKIRDHRMRKNIEATYVIHIWEPVADEKRRTVYFYRRLPASGITIHSHTRATRTTWGALYLAWKFLRKA